MDELERLENGLKCADEGPLKDDVSAVCRELRAARKWVKDNWNDDVSGRIAQSLAEKMKEARGE